MSLSDLASLGSFVSGVAVLVSLIFLYFQLRQLGQQVRQADRNQQAAIRQGRSTRSVELAQTRTEPGLAEAWRRGLQSPGEITQAELDQFLDYVRAFLLHLEDGYYQHEEGLLNEDAFQTMRAGTHGVACFVGFRAAWKDIRRDFDRGFVNFMDDIVARASHEPAGISDLSNNGGTPLPPRPRAGQVGRPSNGPLRIDCGSWLPYQKLTFANVVLKSWAATFCRPSAA